LFHTQALDDQHGLLKVLFIRIKHDFLQLTIRASHGPSFLNQYVDNLSSRLQVLSTHAVLIEVQRQEFRFLRLVLGFVRYIFQAQT
jgi:hypothetical protein